jgi:hypothetical protein
MDPIFNFIMCPFKNCMEHLKIDLCEIFKRKKAV